MGDKTKDDAAIRAVLASSAVKPVAEAYRTALAASNQAKICAGSDMSTEAEVAQAQRALQKSLSEALGTKANEPYGKPIGKKHPVTLAEAAVASIRAETSKSIAFEGEVPVCNTQLASASQPQRGGQGR